ncbi:MAG: apolipoprotein N-acyltransferase [Acidobacteriota bacterium]|nr:apolipoprotein N-acyltransferase [Acidobacteriota bacterium]
MTVGRPRLLRSALPPLAGVAMAWTFVAAGGVVISLAGFAVFFALLLSAEPRRAAFEALVAVWVYYVLVLRWFAAAILDFSTLSPWLAGGAVAAAAGLLAAGGAVLGWCAARWRGRLGRGGGALALAVGWVGLELFRTRYPVPFPWGSFAALVAPRPWAARLASWVGTEGLSLLVALGVATGALVLLGRFRAGLPLLLMVAGGAAIPSAAVPGEGSREVRVAAVQGSASSQASDLQRLELYEALTRQAARQGAQLVVWPESAVRYRVDRHEGYRSRLEGLAAAEGVDLVVGSVVAGDAGERLNAAALVRGDVGLMTVSAKRTLVPFGEYLPLRFVFGTLPALAAEAGDFTPGREILLHPTRVGRAGVLVCYEAVFPSLARQLARAGGRILINITNDRWFGWTRGPGQHLRHARLRAAETGLPLVRAANSGISAIFSRRGELLGRLEVGQRGVLVRSIRVGASPVAGVAVGRMVAWLCATLSILLLLLAVVPPRKTRRRPVVGAVVRAGDGDA